MKKSLTKSNANSLVNLSAKDQVSHREDEDESEEVVKSYDSMNNDIIASYDTAAAGKPMTRFSLRNMRRRRLMHEDSELRKKAFQK